MLGQSIGGLDRAAAAAFRRRHIGVVAQEAGLVDYLSATENVTLAMSVRGRRRGRGGRRDRPHLALAVRSRAAARPSGRTPLGRRAPAGRDRPRARLRARPAPDRRAHVAARPGQRGDRRPDARRRRPAPRRDHRLRHPRSARDRAGRPRAPARTGRLTGSAGHRMIDLGGNHSSSIHRRHGGRPPCRDRAPGLALAAANLLPSGGFEGNGAGTLAGWKGMRAVLTLRPDGRGGGHAARVARIAGARTYSIVASPNPASAVAKRLYRARAYLRSGRPGRTVCLKLIELTPAGPGGRTGDGLPQGHRAGWRPSRVVSYTAKHTGDAISLRVVQTSAATAGRQLPGRRAAADRARGRRVAPSAPTGAYRPGGVGTKVALAWHAVDRQRGRGRVHRLPRRRGDRHGVRQGAPATPTAGLAREDVRLRRGRLRRVGQPLGPVGRRVGDDPLARATR